jgi:hypothetical protein
MEERSSVFQRKHCNLPIMSASRKVEQLSELDRLLNSAVFSKKILSFNIPRLHRTEYEGKRKPWLFLFSDSLERQFERLNERLKDTKREHAKKSHRQQSGPFFLVTKDFSPTDDQFDQAQNKSNQHTSSFLTAAEESLIEGICLIG